MEEGSAGSARGIRRRPGSAPFMATSENINLPLQGSKGRQKPQLAQLPGRNTTVGGRSISSELLKPAKLESAFSTTIPTSQEKVRKKKTPSPIESPTSPQPTLKTNSKVASSTTAGGAQPQQRPAPQSTLRNLIDRPSCSLSIGLHSLLTEVYKFEEKQRKIQQERANGKYARFNNGYDLPDGHYCAIEGELIEERYIVTRFLGRGQFGIVVECKDRKYNNTPIAMKIAKNGQTFEYGAMREVEVLQKLNATHPSISSLITRLLKHFYWKGHYVMCFEMMAGDLYQLVASTGFTGVSLSPVQKFCFQILCVLHELSRHSPPLIHADLKPENIMQYHPHNSKIRVIDFGCACYEGKLLYRYIQSRFYRAPEVILEIGYGTPIDRWSLGCILIELHTGSPVFPGHSSLEQLHLFESLLGPIPQSLIEISPKRETFFRKVTDDRSDFSGGGAEYGGQSKYELLPYLRDEVPQPAKEKSSLRSLLRVDSEGPEAHWKRAEHKYDKEEAEAFLNLVENLLVYKPSERISTSKALAHPFLYAVTKPTSKGRNVSQEPRKQ